MTSEFVSFDRTDTECFRVIRDASPESFIGQTRDIFGSTFRKFYESDRNLN